MKKLILNLFILALFLIAAVAVHGYTTTIIRSADNSISYLIEEPNDPNEPSDNSPE